MMKKRLTAVLISVSVTAALIMSGCADTSAAGKEPVSDSGEIADSNNADSKTADSYADNQGVCSACTGCIGAHHTETGLSA